MVYAYLLWLYKYDLNTGIIYQENMLMLRNMKKPRKTNVPVDFC